MVDSTGAGENMAVHMVNEIISGGATVHLLGGGDTAAYGDGDTEITTKSDANVSVAEAAWTVTPAAGFNGVTTLENDNELDFGEPNIGVVDHIVIQNNVDGSLWVLADEPSNPNLTGEAVTIPANTTFYELGNPV